MTFNTFNPLNQENPPTLQDLGVAMGHAASSASDYSDILGNRAFNTKVQPGLHKDFDSAVKVQQGIAAKGLSAKKLTV